MYLIERLIIGSVWLICLVSVIFIPKNKRREATAIMLFTQLHAWILGSLVVEAGLIKYPVRELSKANSSSFSFEYFVLPLICIFFNLYYPENKPLATKLLYYVKIVSAFTFTEVIVEKYTLVIDYIHWNWYYTFISMFFVIFIVRVIYKWFFHLEKPLSL